MNRNATSLMIRCVSCGWVFTPSPGTRPPWCPHCGSDLKAESAEQIPAPRTQAAAAPEPPRPPQPAPPANPGTPSHDCRLPFFQAARVPSWTQDRRLYRVYVTATDLLFISLGTGFRHGAHCAALGGAVGGLIGAAVAWQKQKRIERLTHALEAADEDALRQLAGEDEDSFRAAVGDLHEIRMDPPSGWSRLFRPSECAGVLRCTHARKGALTLDLPTVEDVRVALAELPRLFGVDVQANVSWKSF